MKRGGLGFSLGWGICFSFGTYGVWPLLFHKDSLPCVLYLK